MARHAVALLAITLAGWLIVVDVFEWCTPDGWNDCTGPRGAGLPGAATVATMIAVGAAAALRRPWARTVLPSFLLLPVLGGGALVSESPDENGRELLERVARELRTGTYFALGEVLQTGDMLLTVDLPEGERHQVWEVTSDGALVARVRLPDRLGRCLVAGDYFYDTYFAPGPQGRITHAGTAEGDCRDVSG